MNVVILLVSLAVVAVTLGVMWRLGKWPFVGTESFGNIGVSWKQLNKAYSLPKKDSENYSQPKGYVTHQGQFNLTCPNGTYWDGSGCRYFSKSSA